MPRSLETSRPWPGPGRLRCGRQPAAWAFALF